MWKLVPTSFAHILLFSKSWKETCMEADGVLGSKICKNLMKRELLLLFGVTQLPNASNSVLTWSPKLYSTCWKFVFDCDRKFVKCFVDTVFPAPDMPVMTMHCDILFLFNPFNALAPIKTTKNDKKQHLRSHNAT